MINEEYMRNVISGKTFCPKFSDVRMLPCPRPPHVDVLLKKFHRICAEKNILYSGVDDVHLPDKAWLLTFISTYRPDDEIFKKEYLPPVKETKLSELQTISLPASFVKDLPQSTRRSRRKGLRISKEGIAGQKLERMKRLRKEIGDRILEEEVKTDEHSKKKSKTKSSTNEGAFKTPAHFTPTKKTSGSGSNSKSMLNTSGSSSTQPQAN